MKVFIYLSISVSLLINFCECKWSRFQVLLGLSNHVSNKYFVLNRMSLFCFRQYCVPPSPYYVYTRKFFSITLHLVLLCTRLSKILACLRCFLFGCIIVYRMRFLYSLATRLISVLKDFFSIFLKFCVVSSVVFL